MTFPGCITRSQINTHIWNNNTPLPPGICEREPELHKYGFYRRLNDDVCRESQQKIPCHELVSFCKKEARDFKAMTNKDLNDLMDEYVPERKQ